MASSLRVPMVSNIRAAVLPAAPAIPKNIEPKNGLGGLPGPIEPSQDSDDGADGDHEPSNGRSAEAWTGIVSATRAISSALGAKS